MASILKIRGTATFPFSAPLLYFRAPPRFWVLTPHPLVSTQASDMLGCNCELVQSSEARSHPSGLWAPCPSVLSWSGGLPLVRDKRQGGLGSSASSQLPLATTPGPPFPFTFLTTKCFMRVQCKPSSAIFHRFMLFTLFFHLLSLSPSNEFPQ